ncbi:MAG: hypothetical protein QE269_08705 [Fimbriimonas sp.]|nr:hypothetical protein [Fimbriimonas sp.]
MAQLDAEQQLTLFRAYTKWMALLLSVLILVPTLLGFALKPAGLYLGIQYNFDDHLVYAGWMRQAMEGRFLFENRFTTDPQPGLTLHLYFLVLGWIAKVVGIPVAMHAARVGFTYLSVILLGRLLEAVSNDNFQRKIALALAIFGGGLGFAVWHNFGVAIVKPVGGPLAGWMLSRLPTDVWQPEGYFFYSALTNSLFMVSLCLILGTFLNVLQAKSSKAAILRGALCFGVLMNIHSYDVLLVSLVMLGVPVALFKSETLSKQWVLRALMIALGALPFALWFVYVLKNDPVFQARAATLTYSPNFRQLIFGFIPLIFFGFFALGKANKNQQAGLVALALLIVGLFTYSANPEFLKDGYFLTPVTFGICFVGILAIIFLQRQNQAAFAIILCWALVGLIAPYFPALFQRKLTMMLGIPWGILAGMGIANLIAQRERGQRNLLSSLVILICSATGIQWVQREITLARNNVSNTTVHAVTQPPEVAKMIEVLAPLGRDAIIASLPGSPAPAMDEAGNGIVDIYNTPAIPDLNPVLVGLAGSKAYAGHWSETPAYGERRNKLVEAVRSSSPATALKALGITHYVHFKPISSIAAPQGETLVDGETFALIKL